MDKISIENFNIHELFAVVTCNTNIVKKKLNISIIECDFQAFMWLLCKIE